MTLGLLDSLQTFSIRQVLRMRTSLSTEFLAQSPCCKRPTRQVNELRVCAQEVIAAPPQTQNADTRLNMLYLVRQECLLLLLNLQYWSTL